MYAGAGGWRRIDRHRHLQLERGALVCWKGTNRIQATQWSTPDDPRFAEEEMIVFTLRFPSGVLAKRIVVPGNQFVAQIDHLSGCVQQDHTPTHPAVWACAIWR